MCAQLLLILYLWKEGLRHAITCWFPISTDQFHTDLPHFHTQESFGMQTHVRTSSWESTELHLHLLAVVHGHTTVCIILALDEANSSMDIKSWHSIYMLLSGPVSVPLIWGDTFLWKSSLYTDLSVSNKMFLEQFSEETIIPANWPHIGNRECVSIQDIEVVLVFVGLW